MAIQVEVMGAEKLAPSARLSESLEQQRRRAAWTAERTKEGRWWMYEARSDRRRRIDVEY